MANEIKDNIADAIDRFPVSVGTSLDSSVTDLNTFTTEADDPQEIEDWTGDGLIGFTGWIQLVVPIDARVTISVVSSQPTDIQFHLYDEVPTTSTVAVQISDDDDPVEDYWPLLENLFLPAGTYYLCINPYDGATWTGEGGEVTVRVQWFALDPIYLFEDRFDRSETGGIGRASDYAPDGDVSASSVDGSVLRVEADGSAWWEWNGAPDHQHGFYYFDFYIPADVEDFDVYYEIDTQLVDGLATFIYAYANGAGEWALAAYTRGSDAEVVFTATAETWYRAMCHVDTSANFIRLKVWPRDEEEPGAWGDEVNFGDPIGGTWTPYVGIYGATAEDARLDNLIVSDIPLPPEGPHFFLQSYIAGTLDITTDVDIDALIKRTVEPYYESVPDSPEYVATSSADGYGYTLTFDLPVEVEPGDAVIVAISWDAEDHSNWYLEMNGNDQNDWWQAAVVEPNPADQILDVWELTYQEGMPTSHSITSYSSQSGDDPQVQTTKAAAVMVFRNTATHPTDDILEYLDEHAGVPFYTSGTHFTRDYESFFDEDLLRRRAAFLGIWAGGGFGVRSWSIDDPNDPPYDSSDATPGYEEPMTQIANVSADNWANLTAAVWYDPVNYLAPRGMIPDSGELHLDVIFRIKARVPLITFNAWIASAIALDAWIQGLTHTTHPRTGPHTGVHPSSAIVSSATLGSLPAGTDLNTVLQDIDTLLTDLENQS